MRERFGEGWDMDAEYYQDLPESILIEDFYFVSKLQILELILKNFTLSTKNKSSKFHKEISTL